MIQVENAKYKALKHLKHGAVNNTATDSTDTISPLQIFSGEVTNIFTAASEKLSRYESWGNIFWQD